MSFIKNNCGKCVSIILALLMLISILPTSVFAASSTSNLEQGTYQAVLTFTDWNEENQVATGLRISHRALAMNLSSNYKVLQFQVTGYSQYGAIYMVKQDASGISEIDLSKGGKIGTDWTANDGSALANYQALVDGGYTDENINECFVRLTPDSVNTDLDTAIFTISNVDYSKKIGLVGYLLNEQSTAALQCQTITFKINREFTHVTQLPTIVATGDNTVELGVDFLTWEYSMNSSIIKSSSWNKITAYKPSDSSLNEVDITKVEYEVDRTTYSVTAKIYLADSYKEAGTEVYEAVSRSTEENGLFRQGYCSILEYAGDRDIRVKKSKRHYSGL